MKDTDRRGQIVNELQKVKNTFVTNYIKQLWYEYWCISLTNLGIKDQVAIDALWNNWDMCNWDIMHIENTQYKEYTKQELYDAFVADADYIYDRISFDRLFRTHWLFKQLFSEELRKEQFESK
jgi:hypothetical protein